MIEDMNACSSELSEVLNKQKIYFKECVELSNTISRIYLKNSDPSSWPNTVCELTTYAPAATFAERMRTINDVYRYFRFNIQYLHCLETAVSGRV